MKFLYFIFLGKIRQKTCLVTFQIEKQHFQTIKTWIKKTGEKLAFFQRGQSIVSAKIMKFLYLFFLGKIRQKKCLVTFQIENQHFQTIKTWIKKTVQKFAIFQRGQSSVSAKIMKFLYFFILGKIRQKTCFQRGQSIVSAKIMEFLYHFFLSKIRQKTCLVTFQIENQHFQTIKTWI